MKIIELLNRCEYLYLRGEYEELIGACDDLLEADKDNPIALRFKGIAYCYLHDYKRALEVSDYALGIYPKNYYLMNNKALVFLALGNYEKALEYCNRGLEIKYYCRLIENKIKALIALDRISEAKEFHYYNEKNLYDSFLDFMLKCKKDHEFLKICNKQIEKTLMISG